MRPFENCVSSRIAKLSPEAVEGSAAIVEGIGALLVFVLIVMPDPTVSDA